jgi:hypothetical protein
MLSPWIDRIGRLAVWMTSSAASAWTTFLVLQAVNRHGHAVPADRPRAPFVARTGYVI